MKDKTKVKKRSDALKNKAKIMKEVIKDPLMSQRDIAKKAKVSKTTVQEHLKVLPNSVKSDQIEKILAKDIKIVNLALDELERRFNNKEIKETLSTRDIIASADVSAKRYSLLKGDATDAKGGLKEPQRMTVEIVTSSK